MANCTGISYIFLYKWKQKYNLLKKLYITTLSKVSVRLGVKTRAPFSLPDIRMKLLRVNKLGPISCKEQFYEGI